MEKDVYEKDINIRKDFKYITKKNEQKIIKEAKTNIKWLKL